MRKQMTMVARTVACMLWVAGAAVQAADNAVRYPARPVRMIVTFPPGGATAMARYMRDDAARWGKGIKSAAIRID